MKTKLFCLFLLCGAVSFCKAQDSTVVLSTSMFDESLQTIELTGLNGWIFKNGNDTRWSEKEFDTAGWIRLNPAQLTTKNADKEGRFEGWFRMRFRLDKGFDNMQIGIGSSRWAATDVYIDGSHITSHGNTGLNGKPYEENREILQHIKPLQLETEKEYVLALHVVDFIAPLDHRSLKTQSLGYTFGSLIVLTGPLTYKNVNVFTRDNAAYNFLYSGINGFLSVLFWFLYLQNRREKNLLWISISTSLFFIWPLSLTLASFPLDLDFNRWWLTFFTAVQLWPVAMAAMVYTVGEIFDLKYKKALAILGILFVIYSVISVYLQVLEFDYSRPPLVISILLFAIALSSWKKLRGAQWAVVAGIILTSIFSYTWSHSQHYEAGMYLSFPVSLMIYVAMRFREILTEVQVNAKQVVQLSEEKKEQAVKQQKILQEEVARQTVELRTSLENLKSTQAQLIQSEKMASLGELTAGIAHEIQNPLNFVNNFSDVNKELAEELKSELAVGNMQSAIDIANDIKENEQKINHHGKRADAIVRGMLQHSRTSSGQKELTDINALCDEYLRLSYHGLRAKDKSFNAKFITDFDGSVGKINIVPQDIGRVILNLISNAFYAVGERQRAEGLGYEPKVTVSTKKVADNILISVVDNGNGVPVAIKDKIFQPFFTTKPTGQGTGLGLSLAYDIVKAHGGDLNVKTKEGEGSSFIVQLPAPESRRE